MLHSLALTSAASMAVALTTTAPSLAKPCDGRMAATVLEEMLPLARVALDLPGTDDVSVDPEARCIGIQVRTPGTARLVKLLLRGVEVPREAVDLRVVAPAPVPGI